MRKIGYVSAFLFLSLLLVTGNSFAQRLDTFTVSQLIGTELNTQENHYVGQISDVVFDPQGHIASVILSDARGMGSKHVAIPYSAISKIGDHTFVYNTPENVYYFRSDASPSLGLDIYSKEPMPSGDHFSQLIGANVQTLKGEDVARSMTS
jgi:sporulation protein YlmC with PRC-barrel domain